MIDAHPGGNGTGEVEGKRTPVLVLRALGLGDALTGIPALRGLRRAFPGHPLVLAAPAAVGEWLCRLGVVDRVVATPGLVPLRLPADLKPAAGQGSGHIAVNLHGRGPQSNRLLLATRPSRLIAFADPAAGHPAGPPWFAQEHEVDRWCRLVRSAGGECDREDLRLTGLEASATTGADVGVGAGGTYVVVHPGAASASRRWPAARWREVVRRILDSGREVVVTGGAQERELTAGICRGLPGVQDLAGALSLDELTGVVAGAGLLICGDTGVAHLATACGTPSVLLFGPTPPQLWGPAIDPHLHRVLWHGERTAGHGGDPHGTVIDPALDRITVQEVIAAETALTTAGLAAQPAATID